MDEVESVEPDFDASGEEVSFEDNIGREDEDFVLAVACAEPDAALLSVTVVVAAVTKVSG